MKNYLSTLLNKKAEDVTVADSLVIGFGTTAVIYGVFFAVYGVVILVEKAKEASTERRFRIEEDAADKKAGRFPWDDDYWLNKE